ncbi:unnamed protein product [Choristocarpus tenellus]
MSNVCYCCYLISVVCVCVCVQLMCVKVVSLRFGLDNGKYKTLDDVGKALLITRERVRQIEATALHKLRQPYRNYRVKDMSDHDKVDKKSIGSSHHPMAPVADPNVVSLVSMGHKEPISLQRGRKPSRAKAAAGAKERVLQFA